MADYAIIESGGKQFRVAAGQVVKLPSVSGEVGETVELNILARSNGDGFDVTTTGSHAVGTVVEHGRNRKIIVFKKKRRKQYKKTHGHRQGFTAVRIDSL